MFRRLALAALFFVGSFAAAFAASSPDPCSSANGRASVSIAVNAAGTNQLVAGVAGKSIYVCGLTLTIAGSASSAASAQFEYSNVASCASSTTALTGTFGSGDPATAPTPTQVSYGGGGHTVMVAPAGANLCMVSAGTTVLNQGVLTYVQENQ